MKKVVLWIVLMAAVSCVYAQTSVPASVAGKFESLFPGASGIHWKLNQGVYGASFEFQGSHSIAYFDADGEMIAKGRLITERQLPMSVQDKLIITKNEREKKSGELSVEDVYEISRDNGSLYVFTLQNDRVNLQMVAEDGRIRVHKQTEKQTLIGGAALAQLKK